MCRVRADIKHTLPGVSASWHVGVSWSRYGFNSVTIFEALLFLDSRIKCINCDYQQYLVRGCLLCLTV